MATDGIVLSPDVWDRVRRMLLDYERRGPADGPQPRRGPRELGAATLLIKSDVSEEIPAFGCMAVIGMEADDKRVIIKVAKPSTTFRRQYLFNGPRAIPANGRTSIRDRQFVTGLYDSGTPANGDAYGPTPNQWYLTKGYPAVFTVADIEDATGKRIVGRQYEINTVLGKTNAAHAKSASGTINLWAGTAGSETIITSMTISAYNRFAALATGKWCVADWINGQWYLTAGEC